LRNNRSGGRLGVLVEVNCETDFVRAQRYVPRFCRGCRQTVDRDSNVNFNGEIEGLVAKIRENIKIRAMRAWNQRQRAMIAAYIHTGAKVGVLVEVARGKEATVANDESSNW